MGAPPQPLRIQRRDPSQVTIEWADGHTTTFSAAGLRRLCPCALCVHELTGQPLLDPTSVPDDLTQAGVRLVGHYAMAVEFSDGHRTGIFTWEALRGADPRG